MKLRPLWMVCLLLVVTLITIPACMNVHNSYVTDEPEYAPFMHHVYFWLNEPENQEHLDRLVTGLERMKAIETIQQARIGFPAGTPREVVDNSYAIYWLVTFNSTADWQVYNDHPIHEQFVREVSDVWSRVIVYDTVPNPDWQ